MATARISLESPSSGMPRERVTLRSASIATPLPRQPSLSIRASASSLAAAAGSKAGSEEKRTSPDASTRSRRMTSPVGSNAARTARAAVAMRPRSPLCRAVRRGRLFSATEARLRMRCTPASTILLHSARLPAVAVWESWSRRSASRSCPARTSPATITATKQNTIKPVRALRLMEVSPGPGRYAAGRAVGRSRAGAPSACG